MSETPVAPGEGWMKSSASQSQSACVEVARGPEGVQVRNSRDPHGPVLTFTHNEWAAFLVGVLAGEFSL